MNTFKLHMMLETHSEETGIISKSYKDVIISAPSCCEAIVIANKRHHGYVYLTHEKI